MKIFFKYTCILLIIFSILITGIAIYGYNYGWGATIVIYHDDSKNYYPPITVFEMWDEGKVVHRTFLMFPRKLVLPKLTMLTTKKDESIVRESYLAFWIVILLYASGWLCLVVNLINIKRKTNVTSQCT